MQRRSKSRSPKLDRATSENPNTKALPFPQSDKHLELTTVKAERELTRVKPETEKRDEVEKTSKRVRSRMARGRRSTERLYIRFITQAAEANSAFLARRLKHLTTLLPDWKD